MTSPFQHGGKCRIGILGAAGIAKKNARAIILGGCSLAAVASRSLEKSQSWCEEVLPPLLGSESDRVTRYGSYDELLEDASVDAVYVPLPTSLHLEWVLKCIEKGKHVLLEKPCALQLSDLETMASAAQTAGLVLMDGVMFMHHDRLVDVDRTLRGAYSQFGHVTRVTTGFSFSGGKEFFASNIRASKSGDPLGCLGDLGWYCIRIGCFAFGFDRWPHSVRCRCGAQTADGVPLDASAEVFWEREGEEPGSAVTSPSSGSAAQTGGGGVPQPPLCLSFHCSFLHPFRQWVEICGSSGKTLTIPDFVISKSSSPGAAVYSLKTHGTSGPLVDYDCRVVESEETVQAGFCVQEAKMFERFASLIAHKMAFGGGGWGPSPVHSHSHVATVSQGNAGPSLSSGLPSSSPHASATLGASSTGVGGVTPGGLPTSQMQVAMGAPDFWPRVSLLTQAIVDRCAESAKKGGVTVPLGPRASWMDARKGEKEE
uniref:Gfo/Idh/MocA-like oxidoreductase N-terminal domain-containing protein n=1 Tax=Chromera velia CCMP2878 TaxID=1169474 RepID=A0A0G4FDD6_9ALVE|eukprot:Cvel_16371.t1-p1 / transcript=Cvel_16371.t1 / gene=Cvel_16371 / organism=Chromera_velia_CCMP2878 / gene_product=Uncharacterized oxidoreductase At4g09670, putative / transcript_product=Uncharacterized oxidoreductase At4g09670, putative / location=Cvel_scaffold1258:32766-37258(-) / protein_length=483 / sequence_SO=supercontig / SO=protein_coding / is_pseudo=false